MSHFDFKQFYRRNLPHVQPPEATLFVTFRLANSIPQSVLEEWRREKKRLEAEQLRREATTVEELDPAVAVEERRAFQRRWFSKFESAMHEETAGPVWLKDHRVAEIISEALHHRDGDVYRLDAFSIMPNHVHTVFAPLLTEPTARKLAERIWVRKLAKRGERVTQTDSLPESDDERSVLSVIMQSLKGYTARQCNLTLGRSGEFWQHENFDHVVRDQSEFRRTLKYVLNNPVKAGFVSCWQDWKWNYCRAPLIDASM